MSNDALPWLLLGGGVLAVGGILLYSRQASASAPPAKVQARIATSNDPVFLKQLAAGLQKSGNTTQALDALQKAADITGVVQQVPGAASLPPITVTPGPMSATAARATGGSPTSYQVANGDYPGAIAKRFGTTLGALANANGPKKARVAGGTIRVNETLSLPPGVIDNGPAAHANGTAS